MYSHPGECGRELRADELHPGMVVVFAVEGDSLMFRVSVQEIDSKYVVFSMSGVHADALRRPDGTLQDRTGTKFHVYEWKPGASEDIQ